MEHLRKKPFSDFEREFFMNILCKYSCIVDNKKTDANSLQKKNETWFTILEEFNSSPRIIQKANVKQLKNLWSNMKAKAREAKTKENQRNYTGGGPAVPDMPAEDLLVLSTIPKIMPTIKVIECDGIEDKSGDEDDSFWKHLKNRNDDKNIEENVVAYEITEKEIISGTRDQEISSIEAIPITIQEQENSIETAAPPKQPKPTCHKRKRNTSENIEDIKKQILLQDLKQRKEKHNIEILHIEKVQAAELLHKNKMYKLAEEEANLKIELLKKELNK